MTKQELISNGFQYIATNNCEHKTEVWARFTGWKDTIQYWYYFPNSDDTNPGNVNTISFVGQLSLFSLMMEKMRGDFFKQDIKYDKETIWTDEKINNERFLTEKGFVLNQYPEGKFWELEVSDNEELKEHICKVFGASVDSFIGGIDVETLILQCAEDFTKCLFYYDCNPFDMSTEDFMDCVGKM